MNIYELISKQLTVQVPVKVHMETGYCGSDKTDTIMVDVEDVTDFINSTFTSSIDETISEMAWENAESYGEDSEDCGECEGCENSTGCDDPQDSQSVHGSGTLYRKDDLDRIENLENGVPLYLPETECYVVIHLADIGKRMHELEQRVVKAESYERTLSRKMTEIRHIVN